MLPGVKDVPETPAACLHWRAVTGAGPVQGSGGRARRRSLEPARCRASPPRGASPLYVSESARELAAVLQDGSSSQEQKNGTTLRCFGCAVLTVPVTTLPLPPLFIAQYLLMESPQARGVLPSVRLKVRAWTRRAASGGERAPLAASSTRPTRRCAVLDSSHQERGR